MIMVVINLKSFSQVREPNKQSTFLADLEERLLLLYTGKPRLAKNLLQNVVSVSTKSTKCNPSLHPFFADKELVRGGS